jgi:hypothetical protein
MVNWKAMETRAKFEENFAIHDSVSFATPVNPVELRTLTDFDFAVFPSSNNNKRYLFTHHQHHMDQLKKLIGKK